MGEEEEEEVEEVGAMKPHSDPPQTCKGAMATGVVSDTTRVRWKTSIYNSACNHRNMSHFFVSRTPSHQKVSFETCNTVITTTIIFTNITMLCGKELSSNDNDNNEGEGYTS